MIAHRKLKQVNSCLSWKWRPARSGDLCLLCIPKTSWLVWDVYSRISSHLELGNNRASSKGSGFSYCALVPLSVKGGWWCSLHRSTERIKMMPVKSNLREWHEAVFYGWKGVRKLGGLAVLICPETLVKTILPDCPVLRLPKKETQIIVSHWYHICEYA